MGPWGRGPCRDQGGGTTPSSQAVPACGLQASRWVSLARRVSGSPVVGCAGPQLRCAGISGCGASSVVVLGLSWPAGPQCPDQGLSPRVLSLRTTGRVPRSSFTGRCFQHSFGFLKDLFPLYLILIFTAPLEGGSV